jgi:hypothetical protein
VSLIADLGVRAFLGEGTRTGKPSLCVDSGRLPCAFVQVKGKVELSGGPAGLLRTAAVVAGRCMGRERAEEPGKRNGVPGGLVVGLRPAKVVAACGMTGWLR